MKTNIRVSDRRLRGWRYERINKNLIAREYWEGEDYFIHIDGIKLAVHPDDVRKLRWWRLIKRGKL